MFCKIVWNGIHILPDGYIRMCSIGANSKPELDMQRARDKNGNVMHILTHDIMDIINSDKHCEIRKLNVANSKAWSPHCSCCENREEITQHDRFHANSSRRIYMMSAADTTGIVSERNYFDKIDAEGRVNWMPASLDIRFGNLCNQKCLMCGPTFSSLWYDDFVAFYDKTTFGNGNQISIVKDHKTGKWIDPPELNWHEDPRWWPKFDQLMPFLRHIYITGGEPMVTPGHAEMLDRLINANFAKNIHLEYDSNCSAINPKIIERWSHFKKVDIRGSMDATKDEYELIRAGGKWDKFEANIKLLKEVEKTSNGKIRLMSVSTCFQLLTAYSIIETEAWCNSVGVPFHLRFLEAPIMHSIITLPSHVKQELLDLYKKHLDTSQKADMIVKFLENHMDPKYTVTSATVKFNEFMNFMDKRRGTDWKKTLPMVADMVNRVIK